MYVCVFSSEFLEFQPHLFHSLRYSDSDNVCDAKYTWLKLLPDTCVQFSEFLKSKSYPFHSCVYSDSENGSNIDYTWQKSLAHVYLPQNFSDLGLITSIHLHIQISRTTLVRSTHGRSLLHTCPFLRISQIQISSLSLLCVFKFREFL